MNVYGVFGDFALPKGPAYGMFLGLASFYLPFSELCSWMRTPCNVHILLGKEPPRKPCLLSISETLGRLVDAKNFTQLGPRDGYLRYHQTIVRSAWKIPFCTRGHLE